MMETFNADQISYLLSHAETLVFVDETEKLERHKCTNCDKIAINHHITNCKHVFCRNCIKGLFFQACPRCNVEIIEVAKDAQFEKGLSELNVECQHKRNGCQETIPLRNFEEHSNSCQYSTKALLPKVYEGQSQQDKLKELEDDLHQIKITIKDLQEEYNKESYQNEANKTMILINDKIEIMSKEIQELKSQNFENLKTIQEDYERLKTIHLESEQIIRRQLQSELKEFEQKINEKINCTNNTENTTVPLMDNIQNVDDETPMLQCKNKVNPDDFSGDHGLVYLCKFDNFTEVWRIWKAGVKFDKHIKRNDPKDYLSQEFQDSTFGLTLSVNVRYVNPNITIDVRYMRYSFMFPHLRKFTLIGQSRRADTNNVTFIDTPLFQKNDEIYGVHTNCCVLAPISMLDKYFNDFVKNDSLLLEIRLIPLAIIYKSVYSYNGTLLWHIDNYSKKKQEEIDGMRQYLISDSFYTSQKGYRVQARLYLNGDGKFKGKSISMYVDFIKGEFDSSLLNYAAVLGKFILRDQSESTKKQHISREFVSLHGENNPTKGITNFVFHNQINDSRYLKEDAILIKIITQVI